MPAGESLRAWGGALWHNASALVMPAFSTTTGIGLTGTLAAIGVATAMTAAGGSSGAGGGDGGGGANFWAPAGPALPRSDAAAASLALPDIRNPSFVAAAAQPLQPAVPLIAAARSATPADDGARRDDNGLSFAFAYDANPGAATFPAAPAETAIGGYVAPAASAGVAVFAGSGGYTPQSAVSAVQAPAVPEPSIAWLGLLGVAWTLARAAKLKRAARPGNFSPAEAGTQGGVKRFTPK